MLPVLKNRFGFTEVQMKQVESYSGHPRTQAAAILHTLFDCGSLWHLKLNRAMCTSLQNLSGHEELTSQLIKGM